MSYLKPYPVLETKSGFQIGYPDDLYDATHQKVEYPYSIRALIHTETRTKAVRLFKAVVKRQCIVKGEIIKVK